MKKKCYNCEKIKEGSVISTGVFICYDCQIEQDRYDSEERYADEQRLGSTTKCKRVSYHNLTDIALNKGIEFKTLGQGLQWAKVNGYKVVDAHNRRDDADRQVGLKL